MLESIDDMNYQCEFCDIVCNSYNDEKFRGCKENHHTISKILTESETSKAQTDIQDQQINPKNIFKKKTGKNTQETKIVLQREFETLRPQTLFNNNIDMRMILVYLPTKIERYTLKGDETEFDEAEFKNIAYFILYNPNETVLFKKRKIPYDDLDLKANYQIDVLPSYDNIRWNVKDLENWLDETELMEPKKLYQIIDSAVRRFIEFPKEYQYCFFNLWNIGTYFYSLFPAYPGIDFTGTKRAGKTKALEFQKHVCYNAIMSPNMSGSSLFRIIEGTGSTVLLDETERFRNTKDESAQLLRTLIMQGMLNGQKAIRSEGGKDNSFTPKSFNIYSPKSMAHISGIDDVMGDRFIPLLMMRSRNTEFLNSWPDGKDHEFQQIRNLCYRLFLDHGQEIYNLQEEARNVLGVSGRELQLWTPIITLALFFEKHGVEGLIKQIEEFTTISSKERQTDDEVHNQDNKITLFLDRAIVDIAKNNDGWILASDIYARLTDETYAKEYDIDKDYFHQKYLSDILKRLGLGDGKHHKRQAKGWFYRITREDVDEIKSRLGIESQMTNLDDSSLQTN